MHISPECWLFPEHRPGPLSWMMMPLLLSGVTGLAIQLESSNWSDKVNHAKSGLTCQRKFHILAHTETQERLPHYLMTNQRYTVCERGWKYGCVFTLVSEVPWTQQTHLLCTNGLVQICQTCSPILTYWQRHLTCRVLRENNFPSQLKIRIILNCIQEVWNALQNRKERMLSGWTTHLDARYFLVQVDFIPDEHLFVLLLV